MKKFVAVAFLGLFLAACDLDNPGGVLLGNELPLSVHEYIDENAILGAGEEVIAYYDITISLDNSRSAIITNQHLISHFDGRNTRIALENIARIDHEDAGLIGDIIIVETYKGRLMKIEIAPLNGGEIFLDILRRTTGIS